MKSIPLTQGKVAIVDDLDYESVSKYKWSAIRRRHTWHAIRNIKSKTGWTRAYMHQQLLGFPARGGLQVDHKNGDGLDNRRDNLKACTRQQQRFSFRTKSPSASSKYRGVSWHSRGRRWEAQIMHCYQKRHLGLFASEESAARAYDAAARQYFQEFARLNFPDEPSA